MVRNVPPDLRRRSRIHSALGEPARLAIVDALECCDRAPSELQRIVRKALTKDVDMRYQSARDLLIDLKNLRRELAQHHLEGLIGCGG